VSYAAKKSWVFDMIFWERLSKKYFGDAADFDRLVGSLSEEESQAMAMESLVMQKLEVRRTEDEDIRQLGRSPLWSMTRTGSRACAIQTIHTSPTLLKT
jgi:hypothetical protein